jgi:Predicted transcriptional regulators
MNEKELGARIAKLRSERGMTQLQLAEKLSVSDKTVSKWEVGGGYPDITYIPLISDLFGVTTDYILKGNVRTVQKLLTVSPFMDKYKPDIINENYLSNGWHIINFNLTGDGADFVGLVLLEKEVTG